MSGHRRGVVVNREAETSDVPYGRCCVCDIVAELPNLMMLHWRGPDSARGKGWGCFVCGLPSDGAMAAVCRRCIPDDWEPGQPRPGGEIRFACTGYVGEPGRMPTTELAEPFEHDLAKHGSPPIGYRAGP